MKCPFCGEEMTEGYLESGRVFTWKTKDVQGKKREYLLAKSYMGGVRLQGMVCLNCRKLILDIPENPV